MKLFANGINGQYLRAVLPSPSDEVNWVKAAIAYGTDESTLLQNSLDLGVRLDLWVRYDDTVAVAPPLLRKLNAAVKHNVFCYLVPDILHAKLIWWSGYGVYIGSANLTDRAWNKNIEAGIFLTEAELESGGTLEEIERFFVTLAAQPEVRPLTEEIILEQEALAQKLRATKNRLAEIGQQGRSLPKWEGMKFTPDKQPSNEKHRRAFLDEWNSALTYLRAIAEQVEDYRPPWLEEGIPATWHSDQFLHAYYYQRVTGGRGHPYLTFHEVRPVKL